MKYNLDTMLRAYILKHHPDLIRSEAVEIVTKEVSDAGLLDIGGNYIDLYNEITYPLWSNEKLQLDGLTEQECHILAQNEAMALNRYLSLEVYQHSPKETRVRPGHNYWFSLADPDYETVSKYFNKHSIWHELYDSAESKTVVLNGNWFQYESFIHQMIELRELIMKRVNA